MNTFRDIQLGKETQFSFPRPFLHNPENISGLFSYNGKEGLVWNGLVGNGEPTYSSYEDAIKAYTSKEYYVLTEEQDDIIWEKESMLTRKREDKILLSKNFLTDSYMEKYGFPKQIVRLSLED
jgi:hypothetical protein